MKQLIISIILFTILVPTYSYASDLKAVVSPDPYSAWWTRITFTPTHKELYSIPIKKIDPTWMLASQLKKGAIPREVLFESGEDEMAGRGIDFIKKGDFNKDNIEDLALVGVFQNRKKEQGMFFLILTKNKNGSWKKAFLKSWLGKPGFLGLKVDQNYLFLLFCMDCGGFSKISWDKKIKTYRFEYERTGT